MFSSVFEAIWNHKKRVKYKLTKKEKTLLLGVPYLDNVIYSFDFVYI